VTERNRANPFTPKLNKECFLAVVITPHAEKVGRPQDVHFTDVGYAILADSVVAVINPLLPSTAEPPAMESKPMIYGPKWTANTA